ncbi:MAG TPA: DUF5074 domain-containing protein [Bacteroidia bacterium]|nr:DUF5074 domain-containing protein [Bacteroidia bacterium]
MSERVKTYLLFIAISIAAISCRKDTPPVEPQGTIGSGKRLIICDEGGFGNNNAGISLYDPTSNATVINAYAQANSNQNLGDVLQSVTLFNEKYYLVVNNSGKVVVCDKNFVRLTTISGFISPRYMQVVRDNKAYVSNLKLPNNPNQKNFIQVLDITQNSIKDSIRIDGWTEQMVQAYDKVYVTNQNKKYVYVIDAATDKLDSIYVGATNACIVKDVNEKIWVSCNANASNNISAKLVRINPVADTIEATIYLQTTQNSISHLCINGNGTTLYYLMNDVYKMDINATVCPVAGIITQGTRTFYGLCIDPADETIYISDAVDYNSNGKLYKYQSNANYIGTYQIGLIPGFMLMD